MKFLIVGLGNVGEEYVNNRHNIGFLVLDALAEASKIPFKLKRHAFTSEFKFKGRIFVLIKPTTYMNLSGKAVNYWLQKEKIPLENLLVIVDDIALPCGTLRMREKGGDGGHNGLQNINEVLGTNNYARLRFGIGAEFPKGSQVNYVLGEWTKSEEKIVLQRVDQVIEMIKSYATIGVQKTMSEFNKKITIM
ncbi:MAG: aminoacyl-tRNA hydrolase [Bacteroidota bacterium]